MRNKILLILLGFITLLSCQQDDFLIEHNSSVQEASDFDLKKISFSNLKTNKKALQKIQEINSIKKNSLGYNYRTIYNEQYGVFIDTTHIVMIEEGNRHSITLKIVSDDNENNKVENLILKSTESGGYSAYITEYVLSEQELSELLNGNNLPYKTPVSLTEVENNYQTMSIPISGNGAGCIDLYTYTMFTCTDREGNTISTRNNEATGDCQSGVTEVTYTVLSVNAGCLSGGGGGSSPGGGSGGSGSGGTGGGTGGGFGGGSSGGGGSGSGGTGVSNPTNPGNGNTNPNNPQNPNLGLIDGGGNPIRTTPILTIDPERTHISELNKITTQNSQGTNEFRNKIDEYVGLLDIAQEEDGVMYNKNYTFGYTEVEPSVKGFGYIGFPPATIMTEVIIHLHHNFVKPNGEALTPVPSGGDITGFAKAFREMGANSTRNNLTSIVVTRNGLYAFRVSNPTTLLNASNDFINQNNVTDFEKFFKELVTVRAADFTDNSCNGNCSDAEYDELFDFVVEGYFIDFIKANRTILGIDIYKGELNSQTGNYIWTNITN